MEEVLISVALLFKKGFGPRSYISLVEKYGNLSEALKEEKIELDRELLKAEKEIENVRKLGIEIVPLCSEQYPPLLKEIHQPPIVLYIKGTFPKLPCIAVVGSRKTSDYGRRIAFSIGKFLSENGISTVSGLAYGIDSAAHRGAIKGNGKTIAVLGSGVDLIYPKGNTGLAEKIVETGGAIVSEFPLGTKPSKENFPRRNRIISGLSHAVIVVEAGEKSGALITADFAAEQGRTVFAVPGNIDSSLSRGTNRLIKEGAIPLLEPEDIFDELPFLKKFHFKQQIPEKFKEIYELLSRAPLTVDQIADELEADISTLMTLLLEMEISGFVRKEGGVYTIC